MGLGKEGERPGRIRPAPRGAQATGHPLLGAHPSSAGPGLLALPSPSGQQDPKAIKGERRKRWEIETFPLSGTLRGEALASELGSLLSSPSVSLLADPHFCQPLT